MSSQLLIWGAGAIGGVAGAYLRRSGADVRLVDRDAAHVAAINDKGLSVSGPIDEFSIRIPTVVPQALQGVWPSILLAVKTQHTEEACRALLPHLAPDGYVLSLQNGLCQEIVANCIGRPRTLGACVNYAGDMLGPGSIKFAARGALYIGELDGRSTERVRELVVMLRNFEPETELTGDIGSYLWGKLCFTVMLVAQALGQASIVECFSHPELQPLWRHLVGDVVAAARAAGVEPRAFDGIEPRAFGAEGTDAAARGSVAQLVDFNKRGAKTHSGYWRDIAVRKRKSEAEFQVRPVVAAGERHGYPCVALRRLLAMLQDVEDGRRAQADDNLLALLAAIRESRPA